MEQAGDVSPQDLSNFIAGSVTHWPEQKEGEFECLPGVDDAISEIGRKGQQDDSDDVMPDDDWCSWL